MSLHTCGTCSWGLFRRLDLTTMGVTFTTMIFKRDLDFVLFCSSFSSVYCPMLQKRSLLLLKRVERFWCSHRSVRHFSLVLNLNDPQNRYRLGGYVGLKKSSCHVQGWIYAFPTITISP